jgi:hypothetical protein
LDFDLKKHKERKQKLGYTKILVKRDFFSAIFKKAKKTVQKKKK